MKIKKYCERDVIFLGSKMIMNIVRSFESHQDEVRDNKTLKKDIIIRNAMITYMNSREISQSSVVKMRSHLGAITDDFIYYVRPTARIKPKILVIHTGISDLGNKVNTMQKLER